MLRDRLFETLESEEEIDDSGFELDGDPARAGRGGRLAGRARARRARGSACTSQGTWRAGTGDVLALALADRRRRGGLARRRADHPRGRRGAGRLARPTPTQPKVLHDAKGPMLALAARGWPLAGLVARHRAVGLPRPARPALLRPRRPDRCATSSASSRPRTPADDGPAHLRQRRRGRRRATPRCCTPARCSTSPTRSTTSSRSAAAPGCSPTSSCRWSTLLAGMEQTGIAVDIDHLEALEAHFAGEVQRRRRRGATRVIGKEINLGSPKQLQVVLFDELGMPKTKRTKTGYTTDADALQALYVKTEHPFLLHLLRHRDVDPAAADRRGPAQDGRRRRPHPHHVQPADRGHRPAVLAPTPTCRTSRSAPRRAAGSARRSSSATGYECADDRRLQPDRDADHGAPVRGRRC